MNFHQSLVITTLRPTVPPAWSNLVERWTQLDDNCFTFCEALSKWNYLATLSRPDYIFLVLESASNQADYDFVNSGAASPAKFVFTLPNICASVIFQLLKHSGRTFCLSDGKTSVDFAIAEATAFSKSGKSSWVFTNSVGENKTDRQVQFYQFQSLKIN